MSGPLLCEDPPGRSTIWIHPSIPLRFTFDEPEPPQLNMKWIESLMHSANSTGCIMLVDEVIETPTDCLSTRGRARGRMVCPTISRGSCAVRRREGTADATVMRRS